MAVSFSADEGIGQITLDKPPANSYDLAFIEELADAVREAADDDAVKVVVVRSASEKFFSAGADVKAFNENTVEANMEMIRVSHETLSSIADIPKVFIAEINAHALGGGLEIALACDLRFAAEGDYRLGTPEATLGVLPGNGGTQRLPRLIGWSRALDLMVTGRTVTPAEALELGIVNYRLPGRRAARPDARVRAGACSGRDEGDRQHQARRPRRACRRLGRRPRARAGARRGAVPKRGRTRGHRGVRREAEARLQRRLAMATVTDVDVTVIHDPATGEEVGRAPRHGAEDAAAAVERAAVAFPEWWETPAARRGEILREAAAAVLAALDELSLRLTLEQGKPLREARIEITRFVHTLEHYAGLAKNLRGGYVPNLDVRTHGLVLKRPLGVVVAIVPWNFPTTLLGNKLGPALVCGNVVVAKPAETTPLTTLRIAEIMREHGLPEDVFQVVTGKGSVLGEALVTERRVAKVAFTGSTPVGKHVAELAARGVKRVTLELGGSDPMLVLDDADVDSAVSAASVGRFFNCGQACLAIKRLYLHEAIADEFVEKLTAKVGRLRVGAGTAEGTTIGPLHSETQRTILEEQVDSTLERGGELLTGGKRPDGDEYANGWFYEPTLILEPPHDSKLATEEVFGPALPIWRIGESRGGHRAREREPVRARLVGLDSRSHRGDDRRREARGGLHVDQLEPDRLRRAPVRRLRRERRRQGARDRGARLLPGGEGRRRQAEPSVTPLHFEDVEVGFRFETASRTVTEADLVAFAGVSGDFNPLHTDAVFAARTMYGERIAHGALVLSLATGLRQRAGLFDGTLHGPARDPQLALQSAGSDRRHDPGHATRSRSCARPRSRTGA